MLLDLENTLLAYLRPAIDTMWSEQQVQLISGDGSIDQSSSQIAVQLKMDSLDEKADMRGVGESVYKDPDTQQSYKMAAPVWFDCTYRLLPCVPQSALGQSPFIEDSLRQIQLKLLQPLLTRLFAGDDIPSQLLVGCFADPQSNCQISNLSFKRIDNDEAQQLPSITFGLTAQLQLQQPTELAKPVIQTDLNTHSA